ncbi:MAG: hypothetical protein J6Y68_01400, partial [Clostridia bacterium]|nr:hypothetical protein [Clostridia bacterium]
IRDDYSNFENAISIENDKYKIVNGYNGALFLEEYTKTEEYKKKEEEWLNKQRLKQLRQQREEECFSIVNRGYPYYNQLSEEQVMELEAWYKEWLAVTETMKIPEKPKWIK